MLSPSECRSFVLLSALAGVVFFTGVAAVAGDLRRARVRAEPVPLDRRVVRRCVASLSCFGFAGVCFAGPDRFAQLLFLCLLDPVKIQYYD